MPQKLIKIEKVEKDKPQLRDKDIKKGRIARVVSFDAPNVGISGEILGAIVIGTENQPIILYCPGNIKRVGDRFDNGLYRFELLDPSEGVVLSN